MDAGGGFQNFPDDYAITDALSKAKELTIRLPYYLFAQKPGKELEDGLFVGGFHPPILPRPHPRRRRARSETCGG